ncbi:MAG: TlpA disulfide reductase family protein [Saprospiraceae bacterium]|nr:TlpA disulfide reductase family protein [Saprospiraceae bacterium]
MKTKFCFTLLFLLCSLYLSAQLKGRILGHNGKPLPLAHAYLFIEDQRDILQSVQADASGYFILPIEETGNYRIILTGLHHKPFRGNFYFKQGEAQEITAQLGTFNYRETQNVSFLGSFNGFSPIENMLQVPLEKDKATTTIDADGEVLYQVGGIAQGSAVAGTSGNYRAHPVFFYGNDGYAALANKDKNGKILLQFDQRQLPPWGIAEKIIFDDPLQEAVISLSKKISDEEQQYLPKLMMLASNKDLKLEDIEKIDQSQRINELESSIKKAKKVIDRQTFYIEYLCLEAIRTKFKVKNNPDFSFFAGTLNPDIIRKAFQEIPADSRLWSAYDMAIAAPLRIHDAFYKDLKEYYNQVLTSNSSEKVKSALLLALADKAHQLSILDDFNNYYGRLLSEYPESFYTNRAKSQYNIQSQIAVGQMAPVFNITYLDDNAKTLSNSDFLGKYLLIDFWSIGCGGCIMDMPKLHEAYEQYKQKGLEILSVSLDPNPDLPANFRKKRYPMPWMNGYAEGMFNSNMAKNFEVGWLPRIFLIDKEGKILAKDSDLRGNSLFSTLQKFLDN